MSVLVVDRKPGHRDITMKLMNLEERTLIFLNQNEKLSGRYFTILGTYCIKAFELAQLVDIENPARELVLEIRDQLIHYLSQAYILCKINLSILKGSEKRYKDFLNLTKLACEILVQVEERIQSIST